MRLDDGEPGGDLADHGVVAGQLELVTGHDEELAARGTTRLRCRLGHRDRPECVLRVLCRRVDGRCSRDRLRPTPSGRRPGSRTPERSVDDRVVVEPAFASDRGRQVTARGELFGSRVIGELAAVRLHNRALRKLGTRLGRGCLPRFRLARFRHLDRGAAGTLWLDASSSPPPPQPPTTTSATDNSATSLSGATGQRAPDRGHVGDICRASRRSARAPRSRPPSGLRCRRRVPGRSRKSGRTGRAGTSRRRGRSGCRRRSASSLRPVLGITWSKPRAPGLEVAPGWNSDSTRATAVSSARGRRVSRAAWTSRARNRIGHRAQARARSQLVTGIAGMWATRAEGLPALALETATAPRPQASATTRRGASRRATSAGMMLPGDRGERPAHEGPGELDLVGVAGEGARRPRARRGSRAPTGWVPRRRGRGARRPRSAQRRRRRARMPTACGPSPSGRCSPTASRHSSSRISSSASSVVTLAVVRGRAGGRARRAEAPAGRCGCVAPSASSAAAGSDGCAEAQKSFAKIACSRCRPSRAWQTSPPCSRHGNCRRQYQQRVDCSRLPPIVPMLRSCGEAARRQASRSASGIVASSLELRERRAGADRRSPHAARHDVRTIWTSRLGVHEPVAERGTSSVPPASAA